jgi:peptide chain release factor 2
MLSDELREQLKEMEPDLATILACWKNLNIETKYAELTQTVNGENFWKNPDKTNISQEYQTSKALFESFNEVTAAYKESLELLELFSSSEEELASLKKDIGSLGRKIRRFKIELLLSEPEDKSNCYFNINSGAGGTESQDWAEILCRMFLRFCEREHFKATVLDYQDGEEAGIKSATIHIKGQNAYGFLKAEAGIHRLVRISPYDSNKRRHTSFASVRITPEIPDAKIEINPDDLRIDTYRAGGKGGQHVNKTDSAVRITHFPSGIVVQCQSERSQLQNKDNAMKMLKARLIEKQEDEKRAKEAAVKKQKIEWGSQIRSYVLHPYKMVKDHRTDKESPQPDLVLDGELMPFIEEYLVQESSKAS